MLQVCIKYSVCDLICDVITCCVWSCDMSKTNVYDKMMIETRKKREIKEIKEFLHKSPSNIWFRKRIHSLLSRANARLSSDIIYRMWRIELRCKSGMIIDVKK